MTISRVKLDVVHEISDEEVKVKGEGKSLSSDIFADDGNIRIQHFIPKKRKMTDLISKTPCKRQRHSPVNSECIMIDCDSPVQIQIDKLCGSLSVDGGGAIHGSKKDMTAAYSEEELGNKIDEWGKPDIEANEKKAPSKEMIPIQSKGL